MNKQTKALKMAIKLMKEENLDLTDAYQACKEALEQPAQEPLMYGDAIHKGLSGACKPAQEYLTRAQQVIRANNSAREHCVNLKMDKCEHKNICKHCTHPAPQPAQEPVLYIDQGGLDGHATWAQPNACQNTDIPLYTHPAPSWQGLSDDDMSIIFDKFDWKEVEIAGEYLDLFKFTRAIEQALKEKNT